MIRVYGHFVREEHGLWYKETRADGVKVFTNQIADARLLLSDAEVKDVTNNHACYSVVPVDLHVYTEE